LFEAERTVGTVKPSMRTFDEGLDALGASSEATERSWLMPDAPRTSLLMLLLLCLPCRMTGQGFSLKRSQRAKHKRHAKDLGMR
jgi:hypothetical protein